MNLPRLIIADEIKAGIVSPGLMLVYAMANFGIKMKVFLCSRPESDARLLKVVANIESVSIDSYLCGSVKNLKTLFQYFGSEDALNIILTPLGDRRSDDLVQVRPEAVDLAKSLDCGIVTVFSASASAIQTANMASSAINELDPDGAMRVLGAIFVSPQNPREYQLLEQEFGRRTPVLSLGYLPKEIERVIPPIDGLYGDGVAMRMLQIKSAVLQLVSNPYQVEWQVLEAFGHLKEEWIPPIETRLMARFLKVALVGQETLSLESSNAAEMFKFMKCSVVSYDPLNDPFPKDADVIYFPNIIAGRYAADMLSKESFVTGLKQAMISNKLLLATGSSAPIFGKFFVTYGEERGKIEGLGFFDFHGRFTAPNDKTPSRKVEIRAISDSNFTKTDEKLKGVALNYVQISNPGNVVHSEWAYRDILKDVELGVSGWERGYCFVTDLQLELWSNFDIVNRWLALRTKR
ncbi:hypothetical protein AGMMS50276_05930 [Synergistales bacterium]|nr:hypothetical protein AGMMS50276_05930 [Synergistales bacterium]